MTSKIIDVRDPDGLANGLARAARVILGGGLVAFPTESFYGLGVNVMDEAAINRLLAAKRIREKHPILLLVPSLETLEKIARRIPPLARTLIGHYWPGGLTLVLEAGDQLSELLTAGTGKIGVRLSSHPVATGIAQRVGMPITGTSANVTGKPPCTRADEVLHAIGSDVELILDGGATEGGKGSTVLDLTVDPPKLLREGMVGRESLNPFVKTI